MGFTWIYTYLGHFRVFLVHFLGELDLPLFQDIAQKTWCSRVNSCRLTLRISSDGDCFESCMILKYLYSFVVLRAASIHLESLWMSVACTNRHAGSAAPCVRGHSSYKCTRELGSCEHINVLPQTAFNLTNCFSFIPSGGIHPHPSQKAIISLISSQNRSKWCFGWQDHISATKSLWFPLILLKKSVW